MAALGELVISLSADMAKFTAAMDKASYLAEKKTKDINRALGAIGIGVSVAGITAFVKATIDGADNINKMSQKIGIGVSQLSGLAHAAALSDVEISALSSSMGKFNKGIAEAAATGKGGVAEAFKALNISAKGANGELKSSDTLLKEVAGKFEGMEDGAGKTALAMAMFGKSGADMIPMLNAGSRGIQEMQDEAKALGIVLDDQTAKSAEAFNDNLTRMTAGLRGMTTQVLSKSLPTMERFTGVIIENAKNTEAMQRAADTLTAGLKILASGGALVVGVFKVAGAEIASVIAALTFAAEGDFKKAWAALGSGGSDIVGQISSISKQLVGIWDTAAKDAEAKSVVQGKKIASPLMKSAEEAEKAAKKIETIIKELERTVAAYDQTPTEKAVADALAKAEGASPKQRDTISNLVKIIEDRKAEMAILQQATKALENSNDMMGSTLLAQYTDNSSKLYDLAWQPKKQKFDLFGPSSAGWQQMTPLPPDFSMQINALEAAAATAELNGQWEKSLQLETQLLGVEKLRAKAEGNAELFKYFDALEKRKEQMLDGLSGPFMLGMQDLAAKWANTAKLMYDIGEQAAQSMQGAFSDFFFDVMEGKLKSLGDYVRSFVQSIERAIADALAKKAASYVLDGIGSIFGGGRATGGPVQSGVAYLVGERGPELFTPYTSGAIIPNNQLAGNNVSISVPVSVAGNNALAADLRQEIEQTVVKVMRRHS